MLTNFPNDTWKNYLYLTYEMWIQGVQLLKGNKNRQTVQLGGKFQEFIYFFLYIITLCMKNISVVIDIR